MKVHSALQFSTKFGIPVPVVKKLITLNKKYVRLYEQNHPDADKVTTEIEKIAQEYNCNILWPGLYPLFCKDIHQELLPI